MKKLLLTLSGLALAVAMLPYSVAAETGDTPPAPTTEATAPEKTPDAPAAPEKEKADAPSQEAPAPSDSSAKAETPATPKKFSETDLVMEVNGLPITVLDVRELFTGRYGREFEQIPEEQRALVMPQLQQMIMNELIQRRLLQSAADKEGMKVSDEEIEAALAEISKQLPEGTDLDQFAKDSGISIARIREQIHQDLKVRKLYDKVTVDVKTPDESEARGYFDAHSQEFEQAESVDASHILIATEGITDATQLAAKEKIAKELHDEIVAKKGENFAEMAKLHSDCPSKVQSGDLGEFEKGQMVKEFEDAAFSQAIGEIGNVVKTEFGYHIIRVNERKEAKTLSFDEVKEELTESLFDQAKSAKLESYIAELREAANIVYPEGMEPKGAKEEAPIKPS